jgi:5-methylcytosine-specific restriction protein A
MTKRITGRRLQEKRRRLFQQQPLCVRCEAKGRVRLATQRDHVIALAHNGPDIESNTQGLCAECHAEKTATDLNFKPRMRVGLDGYPVEA